ncbi:MAG: hypothetical protein AB8B74_14680 [Crocinitomicaceae bacterium]
MSTIIKHQSFNAQLVKHDIFNIAYHDNSTSTLADLTEGYNAFVSLSEGKPLKVLIEVGKSAYFDIEANECVRDGKLIPKAEAIVTDSLAVRLVVDYYLFSRKHNHLVRIFKNRALALSWLNTI